MSTFDLASPIVMVTTEVCFGAGRPVAIAHAERPLSVRSDDLRRDARQRARRAGGSGSQGSSGRGLAAGAASAASMPGRGVRCDRRRRKTRRDERRNNKFRRDKAGNPPLRLPMAPAAEEPLLRRPSKVVDNRVSTRKSGECRMNESSRRATASAVSLLLLLAPASAAAQQQGGMLRIAHRDSPASMSTLEEVTISTVAPMMAVFSNLVVFDQHVPQNTLASIAPDLAESWSWNEDGK